jgi:hypothetical protein
MTAKKWKKIFYKATFLAVTVPGLRSVHECVDEGELYEAEEDDNSAARHPHVNGLTKQTFVEDEI